MKKLPLILLLIIVILVVGTLGYEKFYPKNEQVMVPPLDSATPLPSLVPDTSSLPQASGTLSSSPTPPTDSTSCAPTNIEPVITLDAGAGNIYGTLSLKNTSSKNCSISGNEFIIPQYEAKNITVSEQGAVGAKTISLAPQQTVYSQVHFPNGPQCSGRTEQGQITFTYPITLSQSVVFKDESGEVAQPIQLCSTVLENTDVQVWSISSKPVNQ